MANTKTISARVSPDIVKILETACKQKGVTKSRYIEQMLTSPPSVAKNTTVISHNLPNEVSDILLAFGSAGVGAIVYNVLRNYLPTDKFTEQEIKDYAILGAIGTGVAGFFLGKVLTSKK